MVNRLVSVGDDFTLPAAVKAGDANLPARLQDTALNSTIASQVGNVPGVVADGVTDNAAAIQAALNQGGRWALPPAAGTYKVGSTITINVAGTELRAPSAKIKSSHTLPVFQVNAADVLLDIPDIQGATGAPNFSGITGTFEGSSSDSAWCAVNVAPAAHRLNIPRMFGRGFSTVIRIGGWDNSTGTYATYQTEDVHLGDIGCDYVEFAVALRGTRRLVIDNIHGRYGNTVGSSRPPHLIYFANGGALHDQAFVGTGSATGGAGGQAFQFKDMRDSTIGPLTADGCAGTINVMDCYRTTFGPIISKADTYTGSAGSVTVDAIVDNANLTFTSIDIDLVTDEQSVVIYKGVDCDLGNIKIRTNHTTTATTTVGDIEIRGTKTRLGRVLVDNTGATNSWPAIVLFSGTGHTLAGLEARNVRLGINGRAIAGAVLNVDQSLITVHPTDGLYKLSAADNLSTQSPVFRDPANASLLGHPQLLAADDFRIKFGSGGNLGGSASGHVWRWSTGSTWKADANGYAYESVGTTDEHMWFETGSADVDMEVDIQWRTGEGIVLRRLDDNNHLLLIPTSTTLIFRKVEAGVSTTLASATLAHTAGRWQTLRARAQGDTFRFWEDGVPQISHTLTAAEQTLFGTNGNHGFRSSSNTARFKPVRMLKV